MSDWENAKLITGDYVTARTPPHSIEAEEYLLSCCLLDGSDTISRCIEANLQPAAFYSPANRLIYEKLAELYQKSPPVDLAVLAEELKTTRQLDAVGGYAYLTQISGRIPTTAQAGYFLEKLQELHLLRELIKAATSAVDQAFNYQGDRGEFISNVETSITSILQQQPKAHATWQSIGTAEIARAEDIIAGRLDPDANSIPWPWKSLNIDLKPFKRGELAIVAGYTSTGKSSLLRALALHPALSQQSVAFVSLEVSPESIFHSFATARSGHPFFRLRALHHADQAEYLESMRHIKALDIDVFTESSSLPAILSHIRSRHRRRAIDAVFIDYLGLVSECNARHSGVTKAQAVGEVAWAFKRLALQLNCPVFLAVQINRSAIGDSNREPRLSDLKDSGDIEAHADRVILLHRPSTCAVTNEHQSGNEPVGDRPRWFMHLLQAKGRDVGTSSTAMWFNRELTRFELIAV